MKPSAGLLGHAESALRELLRFAAAADQVLSRYFRAHPELGQRDRAFIAESAFAVLRRRRSLEVLAGSTEPRALLVAALVRVLGFSGRALEGLVAPTLVERIRAARADGLPDAVRVDLPDWLWHELEGEHGRAEALAMAQGLLNAAPLDLRVNLARTSREEVLARLAHDGIEASATPYAPSGVRLAALGARAARAQVSNIHSIALAGENDARAKRLARKLERVLVDAPCSGFGTLRRNPDLKWRHDRQAVAELAQKQGRILAAALESSREKSVGPVPVRPQAQPLAGGEGDALAREELRA